MDRSSADSCATSGCGNAPAWPSARRSKTWCQPCLTMMARDRGYEPAEPLTQRKNRWLLKHLACGHPRHSNLNSIRAAAAPICWHCQHEEAFTGDGPWLRCTDPASESAIRAARDDFASMGAILIEDPPITSLSGPLDWACAKCGWISASTAGNIREESRQSWYPCHQCDQERLRGPQPVILYYSRRGLDLLESPARDNRVAYDAICRRCGTKRRVSAQTLAAGAPACLACDGLHVDPLAPHRVYLFHFPAMGVFKVGITSAASDSRLNSHAARGGLMLEIVTLPNKAAALLIERKILDAFRAWPTEMTPLEFPQGGWTECWDAQAGIPLLAAVVAQTFPGGQVPPLTTE